MFESLKNVVKGTVGQTALGAIIGLAIYDGASTLISRFSTTSEKTAAKKKVKKHTAAATA